MSAPTAKTDFQIISGIKNVIDLSQEGSLGAHRMINVLHIVKKRSKNRFEMSEPTEINIIQIISGTENVIDASMIRANRPEPLSLCTTGTDATRKQSLARCHS
jgi:hypothetical protein